MHFQVNQQHLGTFFSLNSDHLKMQCNTVREELFLKIKSDVCERPQFHNLQTSEVAPDPLGQKMLQ